MSKKMAPKKARKILILNGPNLNLLGERQTQIYGTRTLKEINAEIKKKAANLDFSPVFFQSNHEGDLIDFLHAHRKTAMGALLNAGGYTHTSIALRDAISSVNFPVIEVHLSDIKNREPFRRESLIAEVCLDSVMGMGERSYWQALELLNNHLMSNSK